MIHTERFTKEQVQQLKDHYVGNECESDEYRETQPWKGIRHISHAVELLDEEYSSQLHQLLLETENWLRAGNQVHWGQDAGSKHWADRYAGSDALASALEIVFDIMWAHGETPYYTTDEELEEDLNYD